MNKSSILLLLLLVCTIGFGQKKNTRKSVAERIGQPTLSKPADFSHKSPSLRWLSEAEAIEEKAIENSVEKYR